MEALTSIEELNPDIPLGLIDIKSIIDDIDESVMTQGMKKIVPHEESIDTLDAMVANKCANIIDIGQNITDECDDYIDCLITGKCSDIEETISDVCSGGSPWQFSTRLIPTDGLKIRFDRPEYSPIDALTGTLIDSQGNQCFFELRVYYCIQFFDNVPNWVSCQAFQLRRSDRNGNSVYEINNRDDNGNLICNHNYGNIEPDFWPLMEQALKQLGELVNTPNWLCGKSYLPPDDTFPPPDDTITDGGDDTIYGGGGDEKCCPPSKTIINVPPCPPPVVNVSPQVNVTIERVEVNPQIQISDDETINIINQPTQENKPCPDANEIEEIITICGESRMMEFFDRQGMTPLINDMQVGDYIRERIAFDIAEQPLSSPGE